MINVTTGEAQRIADLMPQLPLISDLRGVETYHRPRLRTPLPQQRRLSVAGGGRNERDWSRSAPTEREEPSPGDYAALKDRHPSAGRPFA